MKNANNRKIDGDNNSRKNNGISIIIDIIGYSITVIIELVKRRKRPITKCTWTTSNSLQKMKKTGKSNTHTQDIGMEFGIGRYAMLIMKSKK